MVAQNPSYEKIPQAKSALRKILLAQRAGMDNDSLETCGRLAQGFLGKSEIWRTSRFPALYFALPGEIPTKALLLEAKISGKTPLLPKITDGKKRKMVFLPYESPGDLVPGPWGIMEPEANSPPRMPDLVILPGLAFSLSGQRLGYGGGYYDRYLAKTNIKIRIGFGLSFQIFPELPHDSRDVPITHICCEKGLLCLREP